MPDNWISALVQPRFGLRKGRPRTDRWGTRLHPGLELLEERVVPSLTPVADTSFPPLNGVVSVQVTYNDLPAGANTFVASGAFIDATHVLTAGHVLYDPQSHDNNGFPDQVEVYVGRNGGYTSYDGQTYAGTSATVPKGYANAVNQYGEQAAFGCSDLGILTVGSSPAHANFGVAGNAAQVDYSTLPLHSAGYPADPYYGYNGQYMYQTAGYASGIDTSTAIDGTPLLTFQNHPDSDPTGLSLYIGGQSGSPIFSQDASGNNILFGVFIGSTTFLGGDSQFHGDPNGTGYATALTPALSNFITSTLDSGNGSGNGGLRGIFGTYSTTTSVIPSRSTARAGAAVSFTATVSAPDIPSGIVSFYDNGSYLGQAPLQFGQAVFDTTALPVGTNSVTAIYGGDMYNQGSSSSPALVSISQPLAPTSTSVNASASSIAVGQKVALTADVLSSAGTPGGSVSFYDNNSYLGQGNLVTGQATLTTALPPGSNSITANYAGSAGYQTSASSPVKVQVSASSAVGLEVGAPGSATVGSPFQVTLTAVDIFGNPATGYQGTVTLRCSPSGTVSPAVYTFTPADGGMHTFTVVLNQNGVNAITVSADGSTVGSVLVTAHVKPQLPSLPPLPPPPPQAPLAPLPPAPPPPNPYSDFIAFFKTFFAELKALFADLSKLESP
jgi:V8-like Glu-specific endopeptidase